MKTALITGASRGIGRACAIALREAGYEVIVHYHHSKEAALAIASELHCRTVRADVADPAQAAAMMKETGPVDVLVCNAGVSLFKMFCDMTPEDWQHLFGVNFYGAVNCIQAALPNMLHNKFGRIITIASMWGQTGASCESAYSASKAALIGLTKALAKELGPSGITVNCVSPGVINTDMNACLSPEVIDSLKEETPLGMIGSPSDVANAVVFLANAPFVTGQVLPVNGGIYI